MGRCTSLVGLKRRGSFRPLGGLKNSVYVMLVQDNSFDFYIDVEDSTSYHHQCGPSPRSKPPVHTGEPKRMVSECCVS